MQVSIETISPLERKMTIAVPAEQIESKVTDRLHEAAKTVQLKGFRKGKVPLNVIKQRFGQGVRQEVLGEVMSQSYYEAVGKEQVKPAGQPKIEPTAMEEGKDFEFTAVFEVFPEIELGDFSAIEVERKSADITDADIDTMVETLRKQRQSWQETDRAAQDGDQLIIDFTGKKDGEEFDGGSAKGSKLILGSKRMIEGFESGLEGAKAGEEKVLKLSFPEDYQSADLAGQAVEFTVNVSKVEAPVLPELDEEFYASFDVKDGGEAAFREEVKSNMARELKAATRNNLKNQVIEGLLKIHQVNVPAALVENEINVLRQQTMQQFGATRGQNIDPSMLPAELFKEQAEKRVSLGLIMNEIIQQKDVKVEPETIRKQVEELAESYEQPDEVVKWYYSNQEQLSQVEAMATEEAVIDLILDAAKVSETATSYEEALKPAEAAGSK